MSVREEEESCTRVMVLGRKDLLSGSSASRRGRSAVSPVLVLEKLVLLVHDGVLAYSATSKVS